MVSRSVLVLLGLALAAGGGHPAYGQDAFTRADCEGEFMELRAELDKRGAELQKAGEAKEDAPRVCRLLRSYTAHEAKVVQFLEERQSACQIPQQVIQQAKEGHNKALAMRNNVCKAAAAPPPPPPSAGLSGALGTTGVGGSPGSTGGGGAFDTLTGNILQR